jgi:hypothetical protein
MASSKREQHRVSDGEEEEEHHHKYLPPPSLAELGLADPAAPKTRRSGDALPKMKKFRFQLLAQWIASNFPPCEVADVGGGKGLLAHLLDRAGFKATVIDPEVQPLPSKYRDLVTGKRVRLDENTRVRRVPEPYSMEIGAKFDLLVALHAHGVNFQVIDTAALHQNSAIIMPCCVIGEPSTPPPKENWFMWLVQHARSRGQEVKFFHLNFRGQNVGFYVRGRRP